MTNISKENIIVAIFVGDSMKYKNIVDKLCSQIEILINEYNHLLDENEILEVKHQLFELYLNSFDFDRDIDVKSYEISLRPFFNRIWMKELTNIDNYTKDSEFKLVVCHPSQIDDYTITANLVTDKHNCLFNGRNYGLVCEINESNLLMSSLENFDVYLVSPHSLIVYLYSFISQYNNKFLMTDHYVIGINYISQIENDMILKKSESSEENVFSSILLDRESTNFSKVVLFEPYSENDYENAKKLASEYNLEIVKISSVDAKKRISLN